MKLDWRRGGSAYRALQSVGGEQRHQRGAWQPLLATGLARHFWAHRPAPPLKKRIGLLPIVFPEGDIGIEHLGITCFVMPSLKPKFHPTVSRPNIALPDMRDTTEVVGGAVGAFGRVGSVAPRVLRRAIPTMHDWGRVIRQSHICKSTKMPTS